MIETAPVSNVYRNLENIVQEDRKEPPYKHPKQKPEVDYDSGAIIHRVSPTELPPNVLGMYVPSEHAIYLATEDPFVRYHESGHARGIIDEEKTDNYAAARVGYNLRGFLYWNRRKAA